MHERQILLYDADIKRLNAISKMLRDMGYVCDNVDSPRECFEKIDSGGYNAIFIGYPGEDSDLLKILLYAADRNVDVFPFDIYDPETENIADRIVRNIENTINRPCDI
jgi:DNA-binding NtrC family response regulator